MNPSRQDACGTARETRALRGGIEDDDEDENDHEGNYGRPCVGADKR